MHAALWIDEVLCVIIWQKYPLSVGLSEHDASAISSLILADCPLHYIIQNFKQFFPLPYNFNDATCVIPPIEWTPLHHLTHDLVCYQLLCVLCDNNTYTGSKYHGHPQDFFHGWATRESEGRKSPVKSRGRTPVELMTFSQCINSSSTETLHHKKHFTAFPRGKYPFCPCLPSPMLSM